MKRKPQVVVVEQWAHEFGPSIWYPYGSLTTALRAAASHMAHCPWPSETCARSVWVRERGSWVPA